jgi:ABC-type transport system involved in cytochrome c biogenesis ATPase subunit
MALLQFKPAPMYILDEIDAALDLSHAQHISANACEHHGTDSDAMDVDYLQNEAINILKRTLKCL